MSCMNTYWSDKWLTNSNFSSWIEKTDNKTEAKCKLCQTIIHLSNMGIGALKSHAQ